MRRITLVEYGSYACPYCRAANEQIAEVRDQFGDRLRYVFRHRPLTGSDIARRAAELVGARRRSRAVLGRAHRADDALGDADRGRPARRRRRAGPGARGPRRGRAGRPARQGARRGRRAERARQRRDDHADLLHQRPPLRRPVGRELARPMRCSARSAIACARPRSTSPAGAPSAGVLLLLATLLAVALTNSPLGAGLRRALGAASSASRSATPASACRLQHWVNDGLLTIFFLVVGLEIKREFTVGHLASRRSAALPIAAAIGGMVVPALLYLAGHPARAVVARLGRADGDRHRLRRRADRDAGRARAGRAAHLPDRRGDRRRHRRDRRRRALLFRRAAARLSRRAPSRSPARWRCSIGRACTACRRTCCSASRSGPACTPAACTRRWPAWCWRCSSRPGRRRTCAR